MASKVKTPVMPEPESNGCLPKGWRMVRFGDVVRDVNEAERNPLESGLERYVGLEHIEPENLHLKQWGDLTAGAVSFTKRFRKGQVLFGKRRAYQRKVAVTEFDGICSSDILTFEPKDDSLIPELLPFIVQSDGFFQHALGTSSGSLSPRTRWSQLQDYEFPLPPKHEQCHIAELLCAADQAVTQMNSVLIRVEELLQAFLCDAFTSRVVAEKHASLQELCAESITYGIVQAGPHVPDGIPYIRVSDMVQEVFVSDSILRTTPQIASRFKRSTVTSGDIVFALRGDPGLVRVVPEFLDGANLTQGTARISVRADVNRDFVLWALRSPAVRRQIATEAKGSTFKEITLASLRKLRIPDKARKEQDQIADCANNIYAGMEETKASCAATKSLFSELRDSMLSNGVSK